jgi:biopolymer transport protein ExbD
VASREGVAPLLGNIDGRADLPSLRRALEEVKARHPGERDIVVSADPGLPYQSVVEVMDVARGDDARPLFPSVRLATGVE